MFTIDAGNQFIEEDRKIALRANDDKDYKHLIA